MSILKEQAPEFVAHEEARTAVRIAEKEGDCSARLYDAEDDAFAALLSAIRASAEIALHYRGKATQEQHDSADQNALDTVYEAEVSPESDAGRLIYNRVYVNTLQLVL